MADKEMNDTPINLKSLETLTELFKESFDNEEKRKETLENKASMVLGFSGIIAGLLTGLMSSSLNPNNLLYIIFFFASVLSFTVAGIFALLTVKLQNYQQPFRFATPEEIDKMLRMEESVLLDEFIKNYSDSIFNNSTINDSKVFKLKIAFYSATLGIILTLIAALSTLLV
ncbi:MAG: hypothetical protein ACFFBD_22195 [Candidatus Hodarchaeota archaeon]